jgi:hypothetical protein
MRINVAEFICESKENGWFERYSLFGQYAGAARKFHRSRVLEGTIREQNRNAVYQRITPGAAGTANVLRLKFQ